MERKIKPSNAFLLLIIILPIMDTLNGLINGGGNEGGLSLGIIYRAIILVMCFAMAISSGINMRSGCLLLAIIVFAAASVTINDYRVNDYIITLFRLILPMVIIITLEPYIKKRIITRESVAGVLNCWGWLFPLSIIVPYFLNTGFHTYGAGAAGYKGFYYAQNDIGYILAVLYLFLIYKLMDGITAVKIINAILLLFSNMILGLKSNYLLVIFITLYFIVKMNNRFSSFVSKAIVVISIAAGIILILIVYKDEILSIVNRWMYFYKSRTFLSFWTSSRWDRIVPAFNWFFSSNIILNALFGSGLEYTAFAVHNESNLIEMDLFDLVLQLGFICSILIYLFYLRIFVKYRAKKFYALGFALSLVSSTAAGHIMESALSGMAFSILCCGIIADYYGRIDKDEKQNTSICS